VLDTARSHRDVSGDTFVTQFEIVDKRKNVKNAYYRVKVSYGRQILLDKVYNSPGFYTETLPCPHQRISALIHVEMTNEHGQAFFDSYTVSFNLHFHKMLKWIVLVPFVAMVFVLLYIKEIKSPLPLMAE